MPILRKLNIIYDAENIGLSYFSSDENKGLKSLITHSMASIRLVHNVELVFAHAPQVLV